MGFFRRRANKKSLIIVALLLIVVGYSLFRAGGVKAEWFDQNWFYRKAIEIPSHTASENNVYVIVPAFDATDTSKFQADCGDLRFTKQNGQLLSYYVVDCDATANIHVQFDTLPAGASTYYMYYGNPSAENGFKSADFATAASGLGSQTLATEEKGPGPVAYLRFDEGQGNTAYDDSSKNNDGTLSGATKPAWQTSDQCVFGKCLYFDGSTSYVQLPFFQSQTSIASDGLSWEMWVKTSNTAAGMYGLLNQTVEGAGTYERMGGMGINNATGKAYIVWFDGSAYIRPYTPIAVNDGKWHHLVGTYTPSDGYLRMYADGVLGDSLQAAGAPSGSSGYVVNFQIGHSNQGTTIKYFPGFIDDVKIYPYARTAAQIKSDYNSRGSTSGVGVKVGNESSYLSNGLIGYWKMDEASGAGSTLADSSGNSNTGTAVLWGGGDTATDSAHVAGKFGNGFSFDGGDDYVNVGNIGLTADWTITYWIYLNNLTPIVQYPIGTATGNSSPPPYGSGIFMGHDPGSGKKWGMYDGTSLLYGSVISASNWYYATVTKSGTTYTLYLNGAYDNRGTLADVDITNLTIGRRTDYSGGVWHTNGILDDVRVYNRALSPKEVADLYNWAPGPVGYWKMDDNVSGNSQTLVDSSTYGNTGTTYYGANATGMNCKIIGKYGGGCLLDGTDDYVDIGDNTALRPANVTLETWIKPTGTHPNSGRIIEKGWGGSPTYASYILRWCDSSQTGCTSGTYNRISFDIGKSGGYTSVLSNTTDFNDRWTHVVGTYDGQNLKIYINGVLENSTPETNAIVYTSTNLFIGRYNGAGSYYYNGSIDDVRIYNYARTQKQILEDMNAGHPSVGSPVGSYAGYWKFDEGYGNPKDQSVNGNNGTNNGATWTNNGKFGKALSFNGTSSYVDMGTPTNLQLQYFTALSWIKTSTVVSQSAFSYSAPNSSGWGITLNTTATTLDFDDNYVAVVLSHSVNLFDGKWHQVGIYRDTGNNVGLILDGQIVKTGTYAGTFGFGNMQIGRRNATQGNYFKGLIDEVKIYPFALTADDIKAEYNRGSALAMGSLSDTSGLSGGSVASNSASAIYCIPGDTATCSPPVAEWKMDENVTGDAQTVYDTSGNGNNGTTVDGANNTGMNCKVLGKYATGCSFDGVDDYVNKTSPSFSGNTQGTLEIWIKSAGSATSYQFGLSNNAAANYWTLRNGNQIDVYVDGLVLRANIGTVPTSSWYQLVFTSDGSTLKAYLNGVPVTLTVTNGSNTGQWFSSVTGADTFTLGAVLAGDILYPSSAISLDDLKIFNYPRTPAQIAWDYNRGKPVGWWKFDECQGTSAYDNSGNGNTGTINIVGSGSQTTAGTCTTPIDGTGAWYNGRSGKFNSSLSFDGANDYVDLGSGSSLAPTIALSLEAWIYPTQTASTGRVIDKFPGDYKGYSLFHSANSIGFQLYTSGLTEYYPTGVNLSANNWYHIVATYDGAYMRVYLNGSLVGTPQVKTGAITYTASNVNIGRTALSGTQYFQGMIDDVKIYNYALTPQQIKMDYNQGSAVRFGPNSGRP